MSRKIQFGKEILLADTQNGNSRILKYSLIENPVGFGYSELKYYGVEVEKTDRRPGMRDIRECKTIEGVFFDIEEAISFLSSIKSERVVPTELSQALEKHIKENITNKRAKKVKSTVN